MKWFWFPKKDKVVPLKWEEEWELAWTQLVAKLDDHTRKQNARKHR